MARDYWKECIAEYAEGCGLVLTEEQLVWMADGVAGAHENYGMAFYQPQSPLIDEVATLKRELTRERSKVVCLECRGSGVFFQQGPYHSASGRCFKCNGEGKVLG